MCKILDDYYTLGSILVRRGVITSQQLSQALSRQQKWERKGKKVPLGMIIMELRFATADEVHSALESQRKMKLKPRQKDAEQYQKAQRDFKAAVDRLTAATAHIH